MGVKLKPCPICEEYPKIVFNGYGWSAVCEGHHETNWYGSEDSALETWNEEIEKWLGE